MSKNKVISKKLVRVNTEFLFDKINLVIMIIICIICIYPIWYVVVNSLNDAKDAMTGGIYLWPRKFSLANYLKVFETSGLVQSFKISVARTLIGTIASVLFTSMVAYGLSKEYLIGRKVFMAMGTITLFFSGGLIPGFILLKSLNLLNTFYVFIIPTMFSFYNLLIFNSFFRELPAALEESARLDGANDLIIFLRIILPLSKPVLATIALFNGVFHWNDYFAGVMYINDTSLEPIQTYMYRIIAESASNSMVNNIASSITQTTTSTSIKLATMVVTTLPIICVYPFLQKYFVKGMMIGAVKE